MNHFFSHSGFAEHRLLRFGGGPSGGPGGNGDTPPPEDVPKTEAQELADRIDQIETEAATTTETVDQIAADLRSAAEDQQEAAIDNAHDTLAQVAQLEFDYEFNRLLPDAANATPEQIVQARGEAIGIVQRDIGQHLTSGIDVTANVNGEEKTYSLRYRYSVARSIGTDEVLDLAGDEALRAALSGLPEEQREQIINGLSQTLDPDLREALIAEGYTLIREMGGKDGIDKLNAIFRADTPESYKAAMDALTPEQRAALQRFIETDTFKEVKAKAEEMVIEASLDSENNPLDQGKQQLANVWKKVMDIIGDIQMMLNGEDPSAPGVDDARIANDISRDKHLKLHKTNTIARLKEVDTELIQLGNGSDGGAIAMAKQKLTNMRNNSAGAEGSIKEAEDNLARLESQKVGLEAEQEKLEKRLVSINKAVNEKLGTSLADNDGREEVDAEAVLQQFQEDEAQRLANTPKAIAYRESKQYLEGYSGMSSVGVDTWQLNAWGATEYIFQYTEGHGFRWQYENDTEWHPLSKVPVDKWADDGTVNTDTEAPIPDSYRDGLDLWTQDLNNSGVAQAQEIIAELKRINTTV